MKIAIDIRDAAGEKTGKGIYAFGLINNILKLDQENHYLLYTDSEKNPFQNHKNVTLKVIAKKGLRWHLEVLKHLKIEKPDLFFAPTSYIIPSLAPKFLKVIITVHDLVAFLMPGNHNAKAVLIERLTLKRALKKATQVFVVSNNTKNDLQKMFKYPSPQIQCIPCAPSEDFHSEISQKKIEAVRKKHQLPEKFILGVGTLEPRKNFPSLIKSFIIVKKKHPEYKLVIVGKKGWKYEEIFQLIKQHKLEEEVIFPGYLNNEELKAFYHLATLFVFPSLYEGFGIPPLEAMSSGCPVISSNVASLPEVIGDAGLLIDPKSTNKIAESIISLLENDQIRTMLIERGFRRAQKFSWENSAQAALEAFKSQKDLSV